MVLNTTTKRTGSVAAACRHESNTWTRATRAQVRLALPGCCSRLWRYRKKQKRASGLLLVPVVHLLAAAQLARAAGGDEADLLAGDRIATDGRGMADVLVVTSAVRVLHRVHRHATNLRPRVALHAVLVERAASLQQRLVDAAAARD